VPEGVRLACFVFDPFPWHDAVLAEVHQRIGDILFARQLAGFAEAGFTGTRLAYVASLFEFVEDEPSVGGELPGGFVIEEGFEDSALHGACMASRPGQADCDVRRYCWNVSERLGGGYLMIFGPVLRGRLRVF
jgi:hypothetical protein